MLCQVNRAHLWEEISMLVQLYNFLKYYSWMLKFTQMCEWYLRLYHMLSSPYYAICHRLQKYQKVKILALNNSEIC